MLTAYLNFYLAIVLAASLALALVVLKFKIRRIFTLFFWFLLLTIAPLILGYFYEIYFNPLPEIVVPELRGVSFEFAREKAKSLDLYVRNAGSVFDTLYPAGMVVSQRPEPGRKVKPGRTVSLILSSKEDMLSPSEEAQGAEATAEGESQP